MYKSSPEIKVLHLIGGDISGGAARGAYLLHLGLLKNGIHSRVLTNGSNNNSDNSVISISQNSKEKIINVLNKKLDIAPTLLYQKRKKLIFSTGFSGFDFTKNNLYKEATIINLHWINNGFVKIADLKKIKKPIVWTLRDMWPMTGGCHYAMDCKNYMDSCGTCPQLNSKSKHDLSRIVVSNKKRNIPKSTTIIGISNWMSELAKKSSLFKDFDIRTISNNIDTQEFFPTEKNIARSILGISTNKKIILVGAQSINDFYKGFNKFIDALSYLDKEDYHIFYFGKIDSNLINNLGFTFSVFGFVHDTITLRLIYSAADVFVAPSIMDAFGKTIAEAMACGTAVVCFNATGPMDVVDHMINGYCATPFSSEDIATGIKWVCFQQKNNTLSRAAREKVVTSFDIDVIAKKYIELYNDINNSNNQ